MNKPDRSDYDDVSEWRSARKAWRAYVERNGLPRHIGKRRRRSVVYEPVPGPVRIVEKRVENTERLTNLEKALREAQARVAARDEAPVPESLQDLIDPSLTPREQHDRLIVKFRDAKNLEEMARANGDKTEMMIQLNKAQRLESGIAWNRARLTEQI